ncbi:TRAPPC5/Trs31 [Hexamita inflata]|uniref:TRAPPC5/Trs31 n=1 Tax=Hexamita inflata TaxID=28002 RepID=A0AA86P5T7_9EUKA|nr:TRAPPC5/Trs31 [Hexamita inflata]CAI9931980.1 TRAPPC5/Trs31 [Hexamita inflata]CAI9939251.1 TRAPPC5/Trs31 [Hexamita inflata]CAI9965591.1 TRAPPC5/Trs31 [Hexamita inflata]CAI9969359.1 TRAPPC5/Trs31 [Hexamita inflata]
MPESANLQAFQKLLTTKSDSQINMNLFGQLFCEYLLYCRKKQQTIEDTEKMISDVGYDVGLRMWELFQLKERFSIPDKQVTTKNDLQTAKSVLDKIKDKYWKFLFGKPADALDKIKAADLQFYLIDKKPVTDTFISYPVNKQNQYQGYLPSSFVAGILKSALDSSGIDCTVQVHLYDQQGEMWTYFHIKCDEAQK